MTTALHQRYAIYFCPAAQSDWARLGRDWLGWDVNRAEAVPAKGAPWVTPAQKYGFHATLKAPFRMQDPQALADLVEALAKIANRHAPMSMTLAATQLGPFWAMTPQPAHASLPQLERDLVTSLDDFRAPLNEAEWAKRRANPMTPEQSQLLQRWGYPYVFDQFRFHMTLSDAQAGPSLEQPIREHFGSVLDQPILIDDLCLVGERDDGFFEVIHRQPLG